MKHYFKQCCIGSHYYTYYHLEIIKSLSGFAFFENWSTFFVECYIFSVINFPIHFANVEKNKTENKCAILKWAYQVGNKTQKIRIFVKKIHVEKNAQFSTMYSNRLRWCLNLFCLLFDDKKCLIISADVSSVGNIYASIPIMYPSIKWTTSQNINYCRTIVNTLFK